MTPMITVIFSGACVCMCSFGVGPAPQQCRHQAVLMAKSVVCHPAKQF